MLWSLLQNMGAGGVSFVVTVILARILTPEIFGLVGLLAIFIQVSQTLILAGFNEALIQKKDTDEEDYSSVFWLNLVLSIVIYLILFFVAPFIASFYHQPILTKLTRTLSLVFIINAFAYVQETRLRKEMRFRTLTVIHIPSVVLAAIVSIVMAIEGFGVWSLIAMQLVSQIAYAVQIWIYARWVPRLTFNKARVKRLFSFGGKLMLSAVLNTVFQNIYLVVIGKFFPLSSVGFYQTASKVVKTPSTMLSSALNSVAFPAFSTMQDDNRRLKQGYQRIIKQLLFWICPVFILSAVLAHPLFHFVFGEKWMQAVPFFRLLCVIGIFYPLNSYNLAIVNIKGRSDIFLKLEIIKKVITALGIIISVPFGIWVLVTFQAVNSILAYYINSYFSGRFIQYPMKEQIIDILPVIGLSLVVGVVILLLDHTLVDLPDWLRLVTGYATGGGLYWIIARLNHFPQYKEFVEIINAGRARFSFR